MAEKKDAHDEKLIEELYERLWWYTHEATDEEFDEKEVDAITRLLDILEPVYDDPVYAGGPAAALQRFRERYGETETDAPSAGGDLRAVDTAADEERAVDAESAAAVVSAAVASVEHAALEEPEAAVPAPAVVSAAGTVSGKHGRKASGRRRGGWRRIVVRIGIGLAACLVLLVTVNVGCYAIKEKSFFEIVREGVGRTEITVTGNVEGVEIEETFEECSSWNQAEKIVGENVLKPDYIPEGYELKSLEVQNDIELKKIIVGRYENEEGYFIILRISVYQEEFGEGAMQYDQNWDILNGEASEQGSSLYNKDDTFEIFFSKGKCLYYVSNNESIDILKDFVDGIIN